VDAFFEKKFEKFCKKCDEREISGMEYRMTGRFLPGGEKKSSFSMKKYSYSFYTFGWKLLGIGRKKHKNTGDHKRCDFWMKNVPYYVPKKTRTVRLKPSVLSI
jgi:hypothetical protein